MNIIGVILFVSILLLFGFVLYPSYAQAQAYKATLEAKNAVLKAELASLETQITDRHAQIAGFVLLFNETEQLKQDKRLLEGTIVRLDAEFISAIHRNSALDDVYSTASSAWKREA